MSGPTFMCLSIKPTISSLKQVNYIGEAWWAPVALAALERRGAHARAINVGRARRLSAAFLPTVMDAALNCGASCRQQGLST